MKRRIFVTSFICLALALCGFMAGCGQAAKKDPTALSLDKIRSMERTEAEAFVKDAFGFETKLYDNSGSIFATGGLKVSGAPVGEMIKTLFGTDNPTEYTYVENSTGQLYRVSLRFGEDGNGGSYAQGQKPMVDQYNPDELLSTLIDYCGFTDETKRGNINCGFEDDTYNIYRQKIGEEFTQGHIYAAGGNCTIGDKPGYWVIGIATTDSSSLEECYTNGAIEQVDVAVFEAKDDELEDFFELLQNCSNQDYQDELRKTKNQSLDMWDRLLYFANACNIWEDRF